MAVFYHYTTINALYNMLEESIEEDKDTGMNKLLFHLTHISEMNDTMEYRLLVEPLMKKVKEYAKKKGETLTQVQTEQLDHMCRPDKYILSLSDKNAYDKLDMWRGYGGNGFGLCLGLNFSKIDIFYSNKKDDGSPIYIMEKPYFPTKCIYSTPEEIEKEIDEKNVEHIYNVLTNPDCDYTKTVINEAGVMCDISRKATKYKHDAYKSECEWRFTMCSQDAPKYKNNKGCIKPYMEFGIPISAIESVTIGPCIKESEQVKNIEQFIKDKLVTDIQIKYSSIPYRG